MLIRLIMTVFLLAVSAMPAWANDKEPQLSDTVKQLMDAGIDLYEEEVLDSLQLEVKDRLEGDTYHISYSFTNPTNTALKKKVAFTTVTYDLCHSDDPYQSITQRTDAIDELAIKPNATQTINIALKQPIPVQFNHLNSCTFFFEDNSYLQYNALSESAPASPFHLTPIVSPFGDVSLKIQNYSPTETITELRDIRLNFTIGEESHKILMTEPISLQIKSDESYTIPLFTLASANSQKSASPFTISAKTVNTVQTYAYHINMKINGIPHTYIDNYADATQVSGSIKSTKIDISDTHYQFAPKGLDPQDGAFHLDGSNLYGYVKVKNISKATVASSQISYQFILPYFDHNSHYQEKQISVRLPQDFSLSATKSNYYSFKIPLPADLDRLHANGVITIQPTNRSLSQAKLVQINASAVPKKDYTLLTDVTIENN